MAEGGWDLTLKVSQMLDSLDEASLRRDVLEVLLGQIILPVKEACVQMLAQAQPESLGRAQAQLKVALALERMARGKLAGAAVDAAQEGGLMERVQREIEELREEDA